MKTKPVLILLAVSSFFTLKLKANDFPLDSPTNHLPFISGIDGTSAIEMNICVDDLKCFTVNSSDLDLMDTVSMSWNKSVPGATFNVEVGKKHPKGTFCWKPVASQERTFAYFLVINAEDDASPTPGRTTKTIKLYVKPGLNAGFTYTIKDSGKVIFSNTSSSGNSFWDFGDGDTSSDWNPTHFYQNNGNYKVKLIVKNSSDCKDVDSQTINISNSSIRQSSQPFNNLHIHQTPSNFTCIDYELYSNSEVSIAIIDITGRELYSIKNRNQDSGKHNLEIPNATFNQGGIFMLKFGIDGVESVWKFIRVR